MTGVQTCALPISVGNAGAAHPALLLADVLDTADPGDVVGLVVLADGCEVLFFRATDALATGRPKRSVADQVGDRADVAYARYLAWRGLLQVQPPNRPGPNRTSAPAALRRTGWKHGFVGSTDRTTGITHLPPSRVGISGGTVDRSEEHTSELQSRTNLVCRLLLEKKNHVTPQSRMPSSSCTHTIIQ